MSVFSCRELADDWQITPLTPVLTTAAGQTSVNFDNYGDTEADMGPTLAYINTPPIFTASTLVSDYATFIAAYDAAQAGEVIIIADGSYDWSVAASEGVPLTNPNGTIEDPIYIMAQTPGGVTFTGARLAFSFETDFHVFAGFVQTSAIREGFGFCEVKGKYVRITACEFHDPQVIDVAVSIRYQGSARTGNEEVDNCVFDGDLQNTGNPAIQANTYSTPPHNQYWRIHHNRWADAVPAPVSTAREALVMGTADFPMKFILENNIFDAWNGDDELVSGKSALNLIRNNKVINTTWATFVNRSGADNTYYGLWGEDIASGFRITNDSVYVFFNYWSRFSGSGTAAIRYHQGSASYVEATNGIVRFNIFNEFGKTIQTIDQELPRTGLVADNFFGDNENYSPNLALNDTVDNGNYVNSDGSFTDTEWRAGNTHGTNAYSAANLTRSYVIDASHFDGPGADLMAGVDYDVGKVYGQPSQIPMPTWWKLP